MKDLINKAVEARKNAYAPYSKFSVGAALEADDGKVYTGCNIENGSYGLSMCAERVAIFKAVSCGAKKIRRMVIVTKDMSPPCGACCQVMHEFNPKMEVILADTKGNFKKTNLSKLLPKAFRLK